MNAKREALPDRIHTELLRRISDRELLGGQVLVITDLATEFGCSAIPVREALSRLRDSGLVEYRAMQGFRVSPPLTSAGMRALFIARMEIEAIAMSYAVRLQPTGAVQSMTAINEEIRHLSLGRTYAEYQRFVHLNADFHILLVGAAENLFLDRAYRAIGYSAQSARILHGVGLPDQGRICAEHDAIVAGLAAGNAAEAIQFVRAHIRGGYVRLFGEELTHDAP